MSNFLTLSQVSGGLPGTAPAIWSASTADNLGTITASGYLNDLGTKVKQNDVMYINYSDTSVQPVGGGNANEAGTLGEFYVNVSGANVSLINALTALGTAAAKAASNNAQSKVASVSGSYVAGNLANFGDTAGSITDSGLALINVPKYASVAITAAEFNGMYAAPKLLIAAPGANSLIVVHKMTLIMTFVAAAYAAGGVVGAQYDATAHGAGVAATGTEAAADFFAAASTSFSFNGVSGNTVAIAPFSTTVNKGLYLSNLTQAFTTGDSTWVAKIYYSILATA